MAQPGDDDGGEQRHDGDQQTRGGTGQARLGVSQHHPRDGDLNEGKRQQPLPVAKRGHQSVTMQRDGQQQQGADQRARTSDHQGIDRTDGDADQKIGHAPEHAQYHEQNHATSCHRGIVENAPARVMANDQGVLMRAKASLTPPGARIVWLLCALAVLPAVAPAQDGAGAWDGDAVARLQAQMQSGAITSRELVRVYLARIDAIDKHGPALNSIIELNPDALAIAQALDAERAKQGPRGPLARYSGADQGQHRHRGPDADHRRIAGTGELAARPGRIPGDPAARRGRGHPRQDQSQ